MLFACMEYFLEYQSCLETPLALFIAPNACLHVVDAALGTSQYPSFLEGSVIRKMGYCEVPEAASTTWRHALEAMSAALGTSQYPIYR